MKKLCLAVTAVLACLCGGADAALASTSPVVTQVVQPDPAALRVAAIEERDRQEATQRDKDDLAAQESMAASANSLLKPSWWQVWIGAGGLIGLIVSLSATAYSLLQTRSALRQQRDTNERGLRAYLGLQQYDLSAFEVGSTPEISVTIKNFGQTPAYKICEKLTVKIVPLGHDLDFESKAFEACPTLNPDDVTQSVNNLPKLTQEVYDSFKGDQPTGSARILVVGEVTYETFGSTRTLKYCVIFYGTDANEHMLIPSQNWSD